RSLRAAETSRPRVIAPHPTPLPASREASAHKPTSFARFEIYRRDAWPVSRPESAMRQACHTARKQDCALFRKIERYPGTVPQYLEALEGAGDSCAWTAAPEVRTTTSRRDIPT